MKSIISYELELLNTNFQTNFINIHNKTTTHTKDHELL